MILPPRPFATALLGIALAAAAGCGREPAPPTHPPGHQRMLDELAALAERAGDDNIFFAERAVQRRLDQLQQLGERASWQQRLEAGMGALQMGQERKAIEVLAASRLAMQGGRTPVDAGTAVATSFALAVAWLRLGETQNCCAHNSPESCLMPLRGGAIHTDPEGSQQALPLLLEVLHNTDPRDYWHLAARWLLNVAHMTLGSHPDGVPAAHRLPPQLLGEASGFPQWHNVAAKAGLDTVGNSGGVAVEDFDGDGLLDIMVSDWAPRGQLRLFRNQGDGSFVDRTEAAGLLGIYGGLNLVHADYDKDGHPDVLVLRGAWLFENGRQPNSLLRNRGDGSFVDVTYEAGLGESHYPTQTAAFFDFDRDGHLDLYIGNESTDRLRCPSQLFRNNGDGSFTEIGGQAGVTNDRFTKAVAIGDYDDDGWPDIYVSNLDGANRLYRNQGDGRFVDQAPQLGVIGPRASFPSWFFDCNNDGVLDLFVANYDTGIGHITAYLQELPLPHGRPHLYLGDGKGGFREVGKEQGLGYPSMPMGSNFGDLDNDGWLDIYLGTGDPHYQSLMPNLVYHNQGGKGFRDVTMASGMGHLQKGHGVAIADLDGDGQQDVFLVVGGAYRSDAFPNVLFRNPGNNNRWLGVQLVGKQSNRSAIGARLHAVIEEAGGQRSIYRHVNTGGSFGSSPLRQQLGLGQASRVLRLEIRWPSATPLQVIENPPLDTWLRIVEGELPQGLSSGRPPR